MQYATKHSLIKRQQACEYWGIALVTQTATGGVQVRSGLRQSIPSSSIESWARVK
jgi:hypothetical protein